MIRKNLTYRLGAMALAMSMAVTALPALAQEAGPGAPHKFIHFIVGIKMLDDKDWNKNFKAAGLPNLATQTLFGMEASYGPRSWPVNIATDILYSQASGKSPALGRTVTGSTLEIGVGVRKIFHVTNLHPYVGGGIAYGSGAVTCSGCSSRAPTGIGPWLGAGAYYSLGKLDVGGGLRYASIDGKDGANKLKVGGLGANLGVGFGW